MKLLLYGMGLVGERNYNSILEIRKRIEEVKLKNPEWKHYEIRDNKCNIIEENTLVDWGFNPKLKRSLR